VCKFLTMQHIRLALITLLSILFFATVPSTAQNLQWFANDHFQLTEVSDEAIRVTYQKQPWEAFTLYVGEADFSKNTILSFLVKSSTSINLRIDLMDKTGNQAAEQTIEIKLEEGIEFVQVAYDFGQLAQKIDLSNISHFHFYINPGLKATGELLIKDIKFPKEITIPTKTDVLVFPNPAIDILKFKTVNQLFDEIVILDLQGREVARTAMSSTDSYEWQLNHLPAGLYQYQLIYETKAIAIDRLIIE